MNKKTLLKIGLVVFLILLAFVQVAPAVLAANPGAVRPPDVGLPGSSTSSISNTIVSVIKNILLPLAGIIAVLFIIIGGYQYMTSGANEELAESGKKTLQNSIIGLVIVILSYIIVNVVINAVFCSGSGTCVY
jgi:hypothetical protein